MQQFIKLTQTDGDKVLIRISEIELILENKEKSRTAIGIKNGQMIVIETLEEVEKLIASASVYH